MSDRWAMGSAAAAWVGALLAHGFPVPVCAAVALAGRQHGLDPRQHEQLAAVAASDLAPV